MNNPCQRLSLHHVGGRFGNGGFPILSEFELDMVRVFYDADSDCVDQIRETLAGSAAEVHVLPYCLGATAGRAVLNVNYDTTSSSLYPLNPEYAPFYFFSYNHDFVAGDSLRTMEKREVSVYPLDKMEEISAGTVAPPDFLSMDVQGAEYAVLQGAREQLHKNVLGLVIETGLHSLYQGQHLFGDIQKMLSEAGFYFVTFLGFHDYAPFRPQVGLRGGGFHVLADALFLRRTEEIEASEEDDIKKALMFRKLAFISFVYGQSEYALKCLQKSRAISKDSSGHGQSVRYSEFLGEMEQSVAMMPLRYPNTFSEKYTYELSRRRFESRKSIAQNLHRNSAGLGERLWLRLVYPNIYRIAGLYRFLVIKVWASVVSRILPDSPVERTMKKYGLSEQAGRLKKNRVVQSLFSR